MTAVFHQCQKAYSRIVYEKGIVFDVPAHSPVVNRIKQFVCWNRCLLSGTLILYTRGTTSTTSPNNYTGCSCIGQGRTASSEKSCHLSCSFLPAFAVGIFLLTGLTCLAGMPSVVAILRYVHPEHQSLGLGLSMVLMR